jgi:hypothetical protein
MITTLASVIAGVIAAPLAGGLAYRKERQRQNARVLAIDTPNRIVEQRFVRIGGIDRIQIRARIATIRYCLSCTAVGSSYALHLPMRSGEAFYGGPVDRRRGQDPGSNGKTAAVVTLTV